MMDVAAQVAAARRSVLALRYPVADDAARDDTRSVAAPAVAEPGAAGPAIAVAAAPAIVAAAAPAIVAAAAPAIAVPLAAAATPAAPTIAPRTTLVVTGADRVTWLNGLVTCDLLKRSPEAARYGLFVARTGRILADALVVFEDARVLVSVPAASASTLAAHLDHYLVMEDAELAPDDAVAQWAVHGPRSRDVLASALRAGGAGGELDRTGLGGAVVFASGPRREDVGAAIEAAVAAAGGGLGDLRGWNVLRLESGVPEFGVDFDQTTYPQEATLEKVAVSFEKGCYLGQEVVCMLEMRGHVKRKLVSLVLERGDAPRSGAAVADEGGASAGEVTSAADSPTIGRPVAMARIKRGLAGAGQIVTVGGVRATVVERAA